MEVEMTSKENDGGGAEWIESIERGKEVWTRGGRDEVEREGKHRGGGREPHVLR